MQPEEDFCNQRRTFCNQRRTSATRGGLLATRGGFFCNPYCLGAKAWPRAVGSVWVREDFEMNSGWGIPGRPAWRQKMDKVT